MPIFEYKCRDCGAKFEKILPSAATDSVTCKRCASLRTQKLLSTFAVSGSLKTFSPEPGPCGACGAPRRGMCGE